MNEPEVDNDSFPVCETISASATDDQPSNRGRDDWNYVRHSQVLEAGHIVDSPSSSSFGRQDSEKKRDNSYFVGDKKNFNGGIIIKKVRNLKISAPSGAQFAPVIVEDATDAEVMIRDDVPCVPECCESETPISIAYPENFPCPDIEINEQTILFLSEVGELQQNYHRLARHLEINMVKIQDLERQRDNNHWPSDEIVFRILDQWLQETPEPKRHCLARILCSLGYRDSLNVLMSTHIKDQNH